MARRAQVCPTCKRPFPPRLIVSGPVRQRIVDLIAERSPHGITRDELMDLVYASCVDGGPEYKNVVSVTVKNANRELAPQGFQIIFSPRPRCSVSVDITVNIITLDFETYVDDDYTLKRLSTEAYIRDQRFMAHGAAIRDVNRRWLDFEEIQPHTVWVPHELLPGVLQSYEWQTTAVLAHHAQFDGLILSHVYGVRPRYWFCTLSMARLLLGNHLSVSLDSLARHFGLSAKDVPYGQFKGKHWSELGADIQRAVGRGAVHDVALTWQLFGTLSRAFPSEEYQVIDTTVRMFTEPTLRGDVDLLAELWEREEKEKGRRLSELGLTDGGAAFRSSEGFAELLRGEGIEPETKEGKNAPIYCFARTDQFMRDLLAHPDSRVRTLAEARLGEKSTLLQTRAATLGWMASRGPMPVYLRYCGAHTTRWSGGDAANWQNFKRGSDLRKAICAPDGFLLCPIDLSQIECRILCYLAGQDDYVEKFAKGIDPYIGMASKAYGRPVTKENPQERGTGKQLVLSCGYQAGAATIQNTARLGIYGPPVSIDLATAEAWKRAYRQEFSSVVRYWGEAEMMILRLANENELSWGPVRISHKKIYGPGGTMLHYDTLALHTDPDTGERLWRYQTRNGWTKLYSGKLVENVVQWLARIVMSQAMNRITTLGYRVVNCTHDELLILVPKDGQETKHVQQLEQEMVRTPVWLPGLPLACESALGERYAK